MEPEGEEAEESSHSEEDGNLEGLNEEPQLKEVWLTDNGSSDKRSAAAIGQSQQDLMLEEMESDDKDHEQKERTVTESTEDDIDPTSVEMQDQVSLFWHYPCVSVCACVRVFEFLICLLRVCVVHNRSSTWLVQ